MTVSSWQSLILQVVAFIFKRPGVITADQLPASLFNVAPLEFRLARAIIASALSLPQMLLFLIPILKVKIIMAELVRIV